MGGCNPVPPSALGRVQCFVGSLDQHVRTVGGMGSDSGYADAGRNTTAQTPAMLNVQAFDFLPDAVCYGQSTCVVGFGKKYDELLPTVSSGQIARAADASGHAVRYTLKDLVAGPMAVVIVERLEEIDVEHQQSHREVVAHGPPPFQIERGFEDPAVAEASQGVG